MKHLTFLLTLLAVSAGALSVRADVRLAAPFSDNMVLQRDKPVPVWGSAATGERVTIAIAGQSKTAVADSQGRWMVRLNPLHVAMNLSLVATGKNTVVLSDVAVGDVYLCSGQSNMQFGLSGSQNGAAEVAAANYPNIRLLVVPQKAASKPQGEFSITAKWAPCTPTSAASFSAVGYFFGRELHQKLNVPIGLIDSSWGGTIAEAWTSRQTLETLPEYRKGLASMDAASLAAGDFEQEMAKWWMRTDVASQTAGFGRPGFDDVAWPQMSLPSAWENAGLPDYDGLVWLRKSVDVPANWAGKNLTLHLGCVDDRDQTFFNGQLVGARNVWSDSRDYTIPGSLVKAGRNTIAVRVLDTGGNGGLSGAENQIMRLERADVASASAAPISLTGAWRYKTTIPLTQVSALPMNFSDNPNQTAVLYNAMIAPLVPFAMRGVAWYQGESNAYAAKQYQTLFPALIRDWRARFGQDLGFYFVQLANFHQRTDQPGERSEWAELREAQTMTLSVPHTGMATIIDIGDANNIHPQNKQDVGHRLALAALKKEYGQTIEGSGPMMQNVMLQGHQIRVHFSHALGLKTSDGASPRGFAITADGKTWVWASARIEGDSVVLSSDAILSPTQVRYGWAENPDVNLYNSANLPAVPFRTDGMNEVAQPISTP